MMVTETRRRRETREKKAGNLKRFGTKVLALSLALALLLPGTAAFAQGTAGFGNFKESVIAAGDAFIDVNSGDWYYENVQRVFELDLMKGKNPIQFAPKESITAAETVALACRLNSIYTGDGYTFSSGDPWYQPYVDYAQQTGLITDGEIADYTAPVTRGLFAQVMAALPDGMLTAIKTVADGSIPDVPMTSPYAAGIYKLYRAGITQGSDGGAFHPDSTITRGEVAAMAARLAQPYLRVTGNTQEKKVTLYADDGSKMSVDQSKAVTWKKLGWRTAPFKPSTSSVAAILNSASLTPMLTGDTELDQMTANILAKIITDKMTTYQKVKACYDYIIKHTVYGSNGVLEIYAPIPYASYDDNLIVLEAKELFKNGKGVCDDYTSAFLVLTRRIGLRCYFTGGETSKASGGFTPHAWDIICVGSTPYVFDAQIEDKLAKGGTIGYVRFCKTYAQVSKKYTGYNTETSIMDFNNFVKSDATSANVIGF